MDIYMLDRDTIIKQTVQNMVEAGVVEPHEQDILIGALQRLDPAGLLIALIQSHDLRERAPEPINFYPIDMEAISKN